MTIFIVYDLKTTRGVIWRLTLILCTASVIQKPQICADTLYYPLVIPYLKCWCVYF